MPPRKLPITQRRRPSNAAAPSPGSARPRRSAVTHTGLPPLHELFAQEYLIDYNATQAYLRSHPKTTYKTASVQGAALLARPEVRAVVKIGHAKAIERVSLEVDDVLAQLAAIGAADLSDFFDIDGSLLPIHALPKHARRALSSVKVSKKNLTAGDGVTEDVVEIKLWDKNRALETLARHLGMIVDRSERGKPGDYDHLAPAELQKELDALREARAKREAARAALPPT